MASDWDIVDEMVAKAMPQRSIGGEYLDLARVAAQGLTLGTSDEIEAAVRSLGSDKSYGEIRKEIMGLVERKREQMPYSSTALEIAGGVPTGLIGMGKTALSTLLRSAGLGGTYGYMSAETGRELTEAPLQPERIPQTLGGAGISGVLGGITHKLFPPQPAATKEMLERGVPLTLGQSMGAKSPIARLENVVMQSMPLAGTQVGKARQSSLLGFNRVAIDEALAPAGVKLPKDKTGLDAFEWATKEYNRIWDDALKGMTVDNPQAMDDVVDLTTSLAVKHGDIIKSKTLFNQLEMIERGTKVYKNDPSKLMAQYRSIRDRASNLAKSQDPNDQELAAALNDASDGMLDIILKYNPDKIRQYEIARNVTMGWIPVRNAATSKPALTQGYFTPKQLLTEVQKQDPTRQKLRYLEGEMPLQKTAQAGMETIGEAPAGSPTAERMLGMGLLGGVGAQSGYMPMSVSLPAILATSGLYARPELARKVGSVVASGTRASSTPIGGVLSERPAIQAENLGLLDLPQYP